jgi:putative holliday junction resolvase
MKVLALDYGSARTGIAVSDPTGTLARPLGVAAAVRTPAGFDALVATINAEDPGCVVVGLPLTLRGATGERPTTNASPRRWRAATTRKLPHSSSRATCSGV